MKPPIRVGIIGLGGFAGVHHQALLKLEDWNQARLVCTCDPRADEFGEQKEKLGLAARGVRVFHDYKAMLDACGRELDMLVIPTPISLHAEMHREGVARGIPVYLEKPPTLDHRELERMIAVDRDATKTTVVGFNFIIERPRLRLKQRILAGDFGKVMEAHLIARWPRPTSYFERNNWAGRLLSDSGGVILDSCFGNAMAHYVHNILFWGGAGDLMSWGSPETVKAELYRAHEIEGADTVFLESRMTDGVTMRFALTHACDGTAMHRETVVCEYAKITYKVGGTAEILWNDGRVESIVLDPFIPVIENHLDYYRYFCGVSDRPSTTLADSRPFVALNNLAYVSSGEILPLPEAMVRSVVDPKDGKCYLSAEGLEQVQEEFLSSGRFPGGTLDWRGSEADVVGPADLSRFIPVLQEMARAKAACGVSS